MPTLPVTSTVTRPVVGFDGQSWTASESVIVILSQTLALGRTGTVTVPTTSQATIAPGVPIAAPGPHTVFLERQSAVIDGNQPPIGNFLFTTTFPPTDSDSSVVPSVTGPSSSTPSLTSTATTSPTTTSPAAASSTLANFPLSTTDSKNSASSTAPVAKQSPSSTPEVGHSSSKGISKGAAAGVGIGCAFAGALIAALIAFLLLRRRRDSNTNSREYSPEEKSPASSKQPNAITRPIGTDSSPSAFTLAERGLPLPLEDAAISGEASKLQTFVKNYVQSYYHTFPATSRNIDLTELGANLPIPAPTLAVMLAGSGTRISAIRFCLMWVISSRISLDSDISQSLLPPEVSNLLRLVPRPKAANGN